MNVTKSDIEQYYSLLLMQEDIRYHQGRKIKKYTLIMYLQKKMQKE